LCNQCDNMAMMGFKYNTAIVRNNCSNGVTVNTMQHVLL